MTLAGGFLRMEQRWLFLASIREFARTYRALSSRAASSEQAELGCLSRRRPSRCQL
jgi:hypothetical protein